jgi:uncharacterized membrane protein YjgN (DUF898 family)
MGVGGPDKTAFEFQGNWRDYAQIVIPNMLLNLATLGFYRFWATTRERQYLYGKTRFIDDSFEWVGTGLELFLGFVIALLAFGLPFLVINLVLQGLIFQNQQVFAGILVAVIYGGLLYLAGVATFRAQRYRLSRIYWHGIHGGTDDGGWAYGWSWLWKSFVAYLCLALLFPWSMSALWKERWEAMSFGPHRFASRPEWSKLMPRYILAYFAPIILLVGLMIILIPIAIAAGASGSAGGEPGAAFVAVIVGVVVAFYLLLPLAALIFYAAYMREVVSTMELGGLEFDFTARTKNWILLFLGNFGLWLAAGLAAAIPIGVLGLFNQFTEVVPGESAIMNNPIAFISFAVIVALAFGVVGPFIRFRNWSFFVRHLEAGGEVSLESLTQSDTKELKQGEGLLDAFDLGAM